MGRPKAKIFWDQVTELGNNRVQCKHCGHKFKRGATRINAHLTRQEKKGVAICPNPPHNFCGDEGVDENNVSNVRPSPQQGAVHVDPMNSLQAGRAGHERTGNNIHSQLINSKGKSYVQARGTDKQHGHELKHDESAAQAGAVADVKYIHFGQATNTMHAICNSNLILTALNILAWAMSLLQH